MIYRPSYTRLTCAQPFLNNIPKNAYLGININIKGIVSIVQIYNQLLFKNRYVCKLVIKDQGTLTLEKGRKSRYNPDPTKCFYFLML